MPEYCSVPGCKNEGGGHRFPRDEALRKKWLVAIKRIDPATGCLWEPTHRSVVCGKHFTPEDYRITLLNERRRLKNDAVPKFRIDVVNPPERGHNPEQGEDRTATQEHQQCDVTAVPEEYSTTPATMEEEQESGALDEQENASSYSFINENTDVMEEQGLLRINNETANEPTPMELEHGIPDVDPEVDYDLQADLQESFQADKHEAQNENNEAQNGDAQIQDNDIVGDSQPTATKQLTVVCLDRPVIIHGKVAFPQAPSISKLVKRGLVGKVKLNPKMSDKDVRAEIECTFANAFDYKPFTFRYLKVLKEHCWLSLSMNQCLTGAGILKLSVKGTIYIMIKDVGTAIKAASVTKDKSMTAVCDGDTGNAGSEEPNIGTVDKTILKEEPCDETTTEETLSADDIRQPIYSSENSPENSRGPLGLESSKSGKLVETVKIDASGNIKHVHYLNSKAQKKGENDDQIQEEEEWQDDEEVDEDDEWQNEKEGDGDDEWVYSGSATSSYSSPREEREKGALTEDTLKAAREKVEQKIAEESYQKWGRRARASAVKARASIAVMNELSMISTDPVEPVIDRRRKYPIQEDLDEFDPPKKRGRPRIHPVAQVSRRSRGRPRGRTPTIRERVGEPENVVSAVATSKWEGITVKYPGLENENIIVKRVRRRIMLRAPPSHDIGDKKYSSHVRCKFCGDHQKTLLHLYQHLAAAHPYNYARFECQECGSLFKTAKTMEQHMFSHRYRHAEVIQQIPRIREGETHLYQCPVTKCGDRPMTWTKMVNHLYNHQTKDCVLCGERIYPCPMKTFCTHLSMHLEGGPYVCPLCPQTFFSEIKRFREHLKEFHGALDNPWICRFCFKFFETFAEFDLHLLGWHSNKPYCCQYCGQEFSGILPLENHMKTHSRGEEYDRLYQSCFDSFMPKESMKLPLPSEPSNSEEKKEGTDKRQIQVIRKDGSVRMLKSFEDFNSMAKLPGTTKSSPNKSFKPLILKGNSLQTQQPVSQDKQPYTTIGPQLIKAPVPFNLPNKGKHQVFLVRPGKQQVDGVSKQYMTLVPLGSALRSPLPKSSDYPTPKEVETISMNTPPAPKEYPSPSQVASISMNTPSRTAKRQSLESAKAPELKISDVQGGVVEIDTGDNSGDETSPIVIAPIQEKEGGADSQKSKRSVSGGDLKVCFHAHCLTVSDSAIDLWINHYFPVHFNRNDRYEFMCRTCASLYVNYDWPPMSHSCKKPQYIYICTDCGLLFETIREKMEHYTQCKYFTSEASIIRAGPVDLLTCKYCLLVLSTMRELCVHLLEEHKSIRFGINIVCCEQCTVVRRFLDVGHLWEHNRVSHSEWWKHCGRWLCKSCGLDHTTEQEFKEHVLYCHAACYEPCHLCSVCCKVFETNNSYEYHDLKCRAKRLANGLNANTSYESPTGKSATVIAPVDDDIGQSGAYDADSGFQGNAKPLVITPADDNDGNAAPMDDVDDESDQEMFIQVIEPEDSSSQHSAPANFEKDSFARSQDPQPIGGDSSSRQGAVPWVIEPQPGPSLGVNPTERETLPKGSMPFDSTVGLNLQPDTERFSSKNGEGFTVDNSESSLNEAEGSVLPTDTTMSLTISDVRSCSDEQKQSTGVPKLETGAEGEMAEITSEAVSLKCRRCGQVFEDFESLRDHARLSHKPESKIMKCPCVTQPPMTTMKWPHKYWKHIITTHPRWMLKFKIACTVCGELFTSEERFQHHQIYNHNHDVKSIKMEDCIEMVSKIHKANKNNPASEEALAKEALADTQANCDQQTLKSTVVGESIETSSSTLEITPSNAIEIAPVDKPVPLLSSETVTPLNIAPIMDEEGIQTKQPLRKTHDTGKPIDGPILISSSDEEPETLTYRSTDSPDKGSDLKDITPKVSDDHVCIECGKKLPDIAALKRHQRIEHPSGLIKCEKCKQRIEIDKMCTHVCANDATEVTPLFPCEFCSEKFTLLASKNRHIAANHRNQLKRCMTCGKAFVTQDTLDKHVQRMHPKVYSKKAEPVPTAVSTGKKATEMKKVVNKAPLVTSDPARDKTSKSLFSSSSSSSVVQQSKSKPKDVLKNAVFSKRKKSSKMLMTNTMHMVYSQKCRFCKKLIVNWSENSEHEKKCAKNPFNIAKQVSERQKSNRRDYEEGPASSLRDLLTKASDEFLSDADSDEGTRDHISSILNEMDDSEHEADPSYQNPQSGDEDDTEKGSGGRIIALRHNVSSSSEDEQADVIFVASDEADASTTPQSQAKKTQAIPDRDLTEDEIFGPSSKRKALEEEVFGPSNSDSVGSDAFGQPLGKKKALEDEVFGPPKPYNQLIEDVFGPEGTSNKSLVDQVFGPSKPTNSLTLDQTFSSSENTNLPLEDQVFGPPKPTNNFSSVTVLQSTENVRDSAENGVFGSAESPKQSLENEVFGPPKPSNTSAEDEVFGSSNSKTVPEEVKKYIPKKSSFPAHVFTSAAEATEETPEATEELFSDEEEEEVEEDPSCPVLDSVSGGGTRIIEICPGADDVGDQNKTPEALEDETLLGTDDRQSESVDINNVGLRTETGPFKCSFCQETFSLECDLEIHKLNSQHF